MEEKSFKIEEIQFVSLGKVCRGAIYYPANTTKESQHPVVVMANGYGAEYRFGLLGFAEKFASAGVAALLFDYRGFGDSEGDPRQLIDPNMQLEDWRAALAFARECRAIDGKRLGIWGSSFAGGHVITLAAQDQTVKAVVSQVPYLCATAAFKQVGIKHALRGASRALWDTILNGFGLSDYKIPVVAEPKRFGVMNHPTWANEYHSLLPAETKWENAIPARSLFKCGSYSPIDTADKIKCPVLIVYAEKDQGVPSEPIERISEKISDLTVESVPGDHFVVYSGHEQHDRAADIELSFLLKQL